MSHHRLCKCGPVKTECNHIQSLGAALCRHLSCLRILGACAALRQRRCRFVVSLAASSEVISGRVSTPDSKLGDVTLHSHRHRLRRGQPTVHLRRRATLTGDHSVAHWHNFRQFVSLPSGEAEPNARAKSVSPVIGALALGGELALHRGFRAASSPVCFGFSKLVRASFFGRAQPTLDYVGVWPNSGVPKSQPVFAVSLARMPRSCSALQIDIC